MVLDILLFFVTVELFMIFMAILGLQDSKESIAQRVVSPTLTPFVVTDDHLNKNATVINPPHDPSDADEQVGTFKGPQSWT